MQVQVERTGKGMLIAIPDELAESFGDTVEVFRENGRVVISRSDEPQLDIEAMIATITLENRHAEIKIGPARRSKYTTEQLLAGVTDDNIHPEVDWGPAVGKEIW